MQTVDIDLIGNTMREPERERLSLILNELGTGLAGRGRDLNEVIRRANPALRETDKVLEILARQNTSSSSSRSTPTRCWRRWRATARSVAERDPQLERGGAGDGGEARGARGRHRDAAASSSTSCDADDGARSARWPTSRRRC